MLNIRNVASTSISEPPGSTAAIPVTRENIEDATLQGGQLEEMEGAKLEAEKIKKKMKNRKTKNNSNSTD